MRDLGSRRRMLWALLALLSAGTGAACGSGEPRTDAERLARGRQIIDAMSAKLASAPSFIVKTTEVRDQLKANGQEQRVNLTREAMIRRPDRMYVRTIGDMDNEVWYDGVGITVALHKEKVFGQARMPETLDRTLDAMHERYGIATPIGDFAYTSPAKALLSDATTGGWVGRETIDGLPADHLAFADTGVHWEVWIPAAGDPLPKKGLVQFDANKHLKRIDITFTEWNLAPQIASDRFTPKVPPEYEGIAILQRARVLKNIPKDDSAAPDTGDVKK